MHTRQELEDIFNNEYTWVEATKTNALYLVHKSTLQIVETISPSLCDFYTCGSDKYVTKQAAQEALKLKFITEWFQLEAINDYHKKQRQLEIQDHVNKSKRSWWCRLLDWF